MRSTAVEPGAPTAIATQQILQQSQDFLASRLVPDLQIAKQNVEGLRRKEEGYKDLRHRLLAFMRQREENVSSSHDVEINVPLAMGAYVPANASSSSTIFVDMGLAQSNGSQTTESASLFAELTLEEAANFCQTKLRVLDK